MLGIIGHAAVLWFIIVFVTQDHSLDWRRVLVWVLPLAAIRLAAMLVILPRVPEAAWLVIPLSILAQITLLYLLLQREYQNQKLASRVIVVYLIAAAVFETIHLIFFRSGRPS